MYVCFVFNIALGPLLIIIYINDIADKPISLSRLFADDTSFGYSNQDTMQLKNVIAHNLASLLNVTPKCLREMVMGTDFPLKEKSRFSGMLRLEKIMISVLSGLNDISHFFDHIISNF
jgi:hypothetical protein